MAGVLAWRVLFCGLCGGGTTPQKIDIDTPACLITLDFVAADATP